VDFKIKIIDLGGRFIKLQICDTAGKEIFKPPLKTYYKGVHGIIVTYDLTDENSCKNIRNWVEEIEQSAKKNVCKVLIGNKCDIEDRKVSFDQGQKLASELNMQFFETSAKTNYNVDEIFLYLTQEILNNVN